MAKKAKAPVSTADMQPDELNALRATVKEFISRMESVQNEIDQLKEDEKALIEEYSDRLDMKTLKAALKVIKIQRGVEHQDTFETFMEVLTDPAQ